ncbi:MAG: histidine triad nucleotide-binding protein [Spirochaetes bacterium]|nr:histidine triad nucleotide-binding protein [Spirochaetota bacterium]
MEGCLFCKIINKEIPGDIVYEDDDILAFNDIDPKAPVHVLIIPKQHIPTFNDIDDPAIIGKITRIIQKIAKEKNIDKGGYRVVANCNKNGGQAVYHLHYHLLGGRELGWPPG